MANDGPRVEETPLPGVGARLSFVLGDGRMLSVVIGRDGHRTLYLQSHDDPDASEPLVTLDETESHTLVELLGGSSVVRQLGSMQSAFAGMELAWIRVGASSPASGRTVGQLQLRSTTGATVVGAVRGSQTFANPGPELTVDGGDTLVVVGTPDSLQRARDLLRDA